MLAWAVLDREEEIFESDDVKDEFKVMHALWARWIVINRCVYGRFAAEGLTLSLPRNSFVADYYGGTIRFIDEYWRMIHRAAGWDALRYWLLVCRA